MKLELDERPQPEDFRVVLDGVRSFNRAQTGNERPRPVACYLRDEAGQIVGGVQGNLWDDRPTSMRFGLMTITAVRDMARN